MIRLIYSFGLTVPLLLGLWQTPKPAFSQPALRFDTSSKVSILLPQKPTPAEQTAAQELDDYLTRITGGEFSVASEGALSVASEIFVGDTQFARRAGLSANALASEEWRIKTQGQSLILVGGGSRGTLYATYRFLEDVAGVRWWNPWEESVPSQRTLTIADLNLRGKPAFSYRDVYSTHANDGGRFAARSRLNRDGDAPVQPTYGGNRDYGPPYHVHTTYFYISPEKYYAAHPDWFIVPNGGTPTTTNSQLRMSHPEMRQEFLKLLRENIRSSRKAAIEKGLPAPDVFSISQEDNRVGFAAPGDEELLKQNGGAESAIVIDFVNFLADNIKQEFPDVYLDTLAYYNGEKAPTTIRPRDNIIIRLTDTTSNLILPITAQRNSAFREDLESWSRIAKNLRVWDYGVTFAYPGLPMPTTHTYPVDFQFFAAHNVEGVLTEHPYPILADMRDFKFWLLCKYLEDPQRDYDTLARDFTNGYYGAAGDSIRRYRSELLNEATRIGAAQGYEEITWFVPAKQYNYLNLDFLLRANTILDEAVRAVASDAVLSRRVRHARLSLDRMMLLFHDKLLGQWVRTGNAADKMPLNRDVIAARVLQTWNEQADLRLPGAQRETERQKALKEVTKLTAAPANKLPVPERFRDVPAVDVFVYGPDDIRNVLNVSKKVEDAQAPSGVTTRLEIPEDQVEKYKLPMPWGIYDALGTKGVLSGTILPHEIPGPGYHWYKMGETALPSNAYLYFFWSWITQVDLDKAFDLGTPNQQFEVWANIKFEGPAFPHGKAGEKNAVSMEQVVLVKK